LALAALARPALAASYDPLQPAAISPAQRTSLSNEIASIQAEGGYLQLPPNYSITVNLSDVALKQVSKNVELEWEPRFARLLVWRDTY
jgi:hypothetical protein